MQMPMLRFSNGFKFKYKDSPFLSQVQFQGMTRELGARFLHKVQNTEQVPSSQDCEVHGSVNFQDLKDPFTQPSPITQLGESEPNVGTF